MPKAGGWEKETSLLRVLDANANRCREGLRVVEDLARFILEHAPAASLAKKLRHEVTRGMQALKLSDAALLQARDSQGDLGRNSFSKSERSRAHGGAVLASNLHRSQEAARVLEELAKLQKPAAALIFKRLRYGIYSLEKQLLGRER